MKPKFKDLKFTSEKELEKWVALNKFKVIDLKDIGQDMLQIIIHKSGEIINCNFHSGIYNGKFVHIDSLKVGEPLML